jgi:hypothetical protein
MERDSVLEANRLLALLPSAAFGMMLPHLSIVSLAAGAALSDDVYFLLNGLVAMFVATSEGQLLYTGLVGKDGAVGLTGLGNSIGSAVFARHRNARLTSSASNIRSPGPIFPDDVAVRLDERRRSA